jgi:hypothetical protein
MRAAKEERMYDEMHARTKALYYLVCFLIWPRPGEQLMTRLDQIARDLVEPERGEMMKVPSHVRIVLSKATKKRRSRTADALISWHTWSGIPMGNMFKELLELHQISGVGINVPFPYRVTSPSSMGAQAQSLSSV